MSKLLLLAASNFVGTPGELRGCLADAGNILQAATTAGFKVVDALLGPGMTTDAWRAMIADAVKHAAPGDLILHAHSHHGAQIPDASGTEADGLCEVWCADDFDWSPARMITDKWMARTLSFLRPGVTWVDWADCCHAADSLRQLWCPGERPRCLTRPDNVRGFASTQLTGPMVISGENRIGIQLAACRSNQTAADAVIDGQPCGAFTHALLDAWRRLPTGTYREVLGLATMTLSLGGYDQRPELDCRPGDAEKRFLGGVGG